MIKYHNKCGKEIKKKNKLIENASLQEILLFQEI